MGLKRTVDGPFTIPGAEKHGHTTRLIVCMIGSACAAIALAALLITLLFAGSSAPRPTPDWLAIRPSAALGVFREICELHVRTMPKENRRVKLNVVDTGRRFVARSRH